MNAKKSWNRFFYGPEKGYKRGVGEFCDKIKG